MIAAFMHDPELLVLDEPTSGLDPLRQRDVLELVRERAAAGRTVFLSSHELDQVEHSPSGWASSARVSWSPWKRSRAEAAALAGGGPVAARRTARAAARGSGVPRSPWRRRGAARLEGSMDASSRSWQAPGRKPHERGARAGRALPLVLRGRTWIEVSLEALRERRRSLLWWTLGVAALVALNVAFYPSVRDDEALSDYAKDLPESVRALFAGATRSREPGRLPQQPGSP